MSDPVLDLLNKQNIPYTISGRDYLIKCLNPEHDDTNPSFRVDRVTGISHCFSCGFKRNIFKHFGVVDNFTSVKIAKLKDKIKELSISFNGVEFPHEQIPFSKPFRDISTRTLKEFGAFYTRDDEKYIDRIWFPIKDISDRTFAFIGRHTMSAGNPRYMIEPRHVQMQLYPLKFKEKFKSVVLVEGIFDLLNCYDKGLYNVVCIFGINSLDKETAEKLLPLKAQGITKIYLMFDGDKPGRQAMDKVKPLIEEAGYIVEIINLEDDTDPGELSQEYVDSIKEYTQA